jgi:hypothetical protein
LPAEIEGGSRKYGEESSNLAKKMKMIINNPSSSGARRLPADSDA